MCITEEWIRTCRAGSHPILIEEVEDEDDPGELLKVENKAGALTKLSSERPL
jgi:hypothetical protein